MNGPLDLCEYQICVSIEIVVLTVLFGYFKAVLYRFPGLSIYVKRRQLVEVHYSSNFHQDLHCISSF